MLVGSTKCARAKVVMENDCRTKVAKGDTDRVNAEEERSCTDQTE